MVQPLAQQQHDVGLAELAGRAVQRAVGVPEAQRMQVVNQTPRLLHGEDGRARGLRQRLQLRRLDGVARRIAHDDDGTLGVGHQVRRLLDQLGVALGPAHVAVLLGQERGQVLLADRRFLQVDGQGQVHWPGPAAHRRAESGGDKLGDAVLVVDQPRPLRNGRRHGHLVDLLEGCLSLLGQLGAAGHEDHRALGGVDGGQAGDGVGETGAAGEQGHRRLAGDARVAVGHVHRRALVPRVDELDALVGRRVHQGQYRVPDNRKDLLHPLLLQAANEQMPTIQLRHKTQLLDKIWVASGKRHTHAITEAQTAPAPDTCQQPNGSRRRAGSSVRLPEWLRPRHPRRPRQPGCLPATPYPKEAGLWTGKPQFHAAGRATTPKFRSIQTSSMLPLAKMPRCRPSLTSPSLSMSASGSINHPVNPVSRTTSNCCNASTNVQYRDNQPRLQPAQLVPFYPAANHVSPVLMLG